MMDDGSQASVCAWLRALEVDDAQAAQRLWDRFYPRLVELAEPRAKGLAKGGIEAEDVAADVMASLWRGHAAGRLADVKSRDELWWLLLALTKRKIVDHQRRQSALKRGGEVVVGPLELNGHPGYQFDEIVSVELSPDYVVAFEEECLRLLRQLRDDQLRQIAVDRIEGVETNDEICQRRGISPATVTPKTQPHSRHLGTRRTMVSSAQFEETGRDPLAVADEVDQLCDLFESSWQRGEHPQIAEFLKATTSSTGRRCLCSW